MSPGYQYDSRSRRASPPDRSGVVIGGSPRRGGWPRSSIAGLTSGIDRPGYGYQSRARPAARAQTASPIEASEATTIRMSQRVQRLGAKRVRGPEPNARDSIASASSSEPSTAVRATGTRTSDHDRMPFGRQPRIVWASRTWRKLATDPGHEVERGGDHDSGPFAGLGRASTSSCGSTTYESGATTRIAAASPSAASQAVHDRLERPRPTDDRPALGQREQDGLADVADHDVQDDRAGRRERDRRNRKPRSWSGRRHARRTFRAIRPMIAR